MEVNAVVIVFVYLSLIREKSFSIECRCSFMKILGLKLTFYTQSIFLLERLLPNWRK